MKKFRICALLVALAVLIAAVPFTAFADGSEPGLIYDFYEKSVMENYGYTSLTNQKSSALHEVIGHWSELLRNTTYLAEVINLTLNGLGIVVSS